MKQENNNDRFPSSVSLGFKIIDVETGAIVFNGQGAYAKPLNDPAQVMAQNILGNIFSRLAAAIGLRGFIGFSWDLTERAGQRSAVITKVVSGTPAEESGLKAGDELLVFNGKSSMNWKSNWSSMKNCQTEPGQRVTLQISRGSNILSVNVTAGDRVLWMMDKTTGR